MSPIVIQSATVTCDICGATATTTGQKLPDGWIRTLAPQVISKLRGAVFMCPTDAQALVDAWTPKKHILTPKDA